MVGEVRWVPMHAKRGQMRVHLLPGSIGTLGHMCLPGTRTRPRERARTASGWLVGPRVCVIPEKAQCQ